jgi:uncharacterized hydantoinase/oxoprolinase family protein
LATGELVYTGVRRTPVCAVLGTEVAAEFFASMLDVYLVLGPVADAPDDTDTADGRPATRAFARARLARMLCADVNELAAGELEALARHALAKQVANVRQAVDQVLEGRPRPEAVVLAGSGEVLGRQVVAGHAVLTDVPVVSLAERLGGPLSEAACAYAVAVLAREQS